jgi:hypothetical protein
MATFSAVRLMSGKIPANPNVTGENIAGGKIRSKKWIFLAGIVLFSSLAVAQNSPTVTTVDPALGKVNDTITVSGSNVGKESVSAVYLSDEKNDYKSTIIDQSNDKITMKVPQVRAGSYNISLQVGDKLFIKPVKFKVEE